MTVSPQTYNDLTLHIMDKVAQAAGDVASLVVDHEPAFVVGLYTSAMTALMTIGIEIVDKFSPRETPMSDAERLRVANVLLSTAFKKYEIHMKAASEAASEAEKQERGT